MSLIRCKLSQLPEPTQLGLLRRQWVRLQLPWTGILSHASFTSMQPLVQLELRDPRYQNSLSVAIGAEKSHDSIMLVPANALLPERLLMKSYLPCPSTELCLCIYEHKLLSS